MNSTASATVVIARTRSMRSGCSVSGSTSSRAFSATTSGRIAELGIGSIGSSGTASGPADTRRSGGATTFEQSVRACDNDNRLSRSLAARSRAFRFGRSKVVLHRAQDRRVVVDAMLDGVGGDPRRDHHCGNARPELLEVEVVLLADLTVGRHCRWRLHVVVEAAVLVVGDDQHARVPHGRTGDRVVDVGDHRLARGQRVRRVLRRATAVRRVKQVAVVRFDHRQGVRIRLLQVVGEAADVMHGEQRDARQRGDERVLPAVLRRMRIPIRAVVVEAPSALVRGQQIEDRPVRVLESVERQ